MDEALGRLASLDPRKARVVELRFFTRLTNEQIAKVLNVSPKTSELDWYGARLAAR